MTSNNKAEPLLITEREAAKMLAVSPRKLWQMAKDGEVPYIRLGGSKRYDPSDLRLLIARKRTETHR